MAKSRPGTCYTCGAKLPPEQRAPGARCEACLAAWKQSLAPLVNDMRTLGAMTRRSKPWLPGGRREALPKLYPELKVIRQLGLQLWGRKTDENEAQEAGRIVDELIEWLQVELDKTVGDVLMMSRSEVVKLLRAAANVSPATDPSPLLTETPLAVGASKSEGVGEIPDLHKLDRKVLPAMLELDATSEKNRVTAAKIAQHVEHVAGGTQPYVARMPELRRRGLTERKRGKTAGHWLTPEGLRVAKLLKDANPT